MKREEAVFPGSRLYRQAAEGAAEILQTCLEVPTPFRVPLRGAFNTDALDLPTASACRSALATARSYAERLCWQVDPYFALPVLMQTVIEFYYGDKTKGSPSWAGTASKIAMALAWQNVHRSMPQSGKGLSLLKDAICASVVIEQLEFILNVLQARPDLRLGLGDDGIIANSADAHQLLVEYELAFAGRGSGFRTLPDSRKLMLAQDEALQSAAEVLRGDSPASKPIFQSTLFEYISVRQHLDFWTELYAFFRLMHAAATIRLGIADDPFGIAILSDMVMTAPPGIGRISQRAVLRKFWTPNWYRQYTDHSGKRLNNMVVERPALRFAHKPCLYVTSAILVTDAFNAFVEDSVVDGGEHGGIKLPGSVFQPSISSRFEAEVARGFVEHGWMAGSVSEAGVWHVHHKNSESEAHIKLEHPRGEPCPGEIDVLTYNPKSGYLLVIECKILARPFNAARLRNIASKLGASDSDSFHSKLKRKVHWLEKTDVTRLLKVAVVDRIIVTDKVLPGMTGGEVPVVPFPALSEWLESESANERH